MVVVLATGTGNAVPCNPHGIWEPVTGTTQTASGDGEYTAPVEHTHYEYRHITDDCPPAGGGLIGGGSTPPHLDIPPPPPFNEFDTDNDGLADCWHFAVASADPQAYVLTLNDRFGHRYGGPNTERNDHSGIDIQCDPGDPVMSVARGWIEEVHYAADNPADRRGTWIRVRHEDGRTSIYCHLESVVPGLHRMVHAEVGMQLGTCGITGNTTGYHLHLIMQDASPSSPLSDYIDPETNLPC